MWCCGSEWHIKEKCLGAVVVRGRQRLPGDKPSATPAAAQATHARLSEIGGVRGDGRADIAATGLQVLGYWYLTSHQGSQVLT
ncbi:hypothetical protein E2C01_065140 [Portunus trituberculatus]|uniref:Uncharacterized protein n=1 Tax=Portunus trituberculatus TaxID=210409 RepID=A0A5B7HQ98_PORTR|nr:hypothetical protein [Portunus trituberculatus]